jgi:hypothetical protein
MSNKIYILFYVGIPQIFLISAAITFMRKKRSWGSVMLLIGSIMMFSQRLAMMIFPVVNQYRDVELTRLDNIIGWFLCTGCWYSGEIMVPLGIYLLALEYSKKPSDSN